ncbi:hypothetical protein Lal_00032201 [Lupinus albus]|nr:hypothetical protein Lal_00032201 [Lupinus albus]
MIHHRAHTILNNVGQNRPSYVPPPIQQQRQQMNNTPAPTKPSLKEFAIVFNSEFDHSNGTNGYHTEHTAVSELWETVLNPRNVSAITLRSGKRTEVPTPKKDSDLEKDNDVDASKLKKFVLEENENTTRETHTNQLSLSAIQQPFFIHLLFPPKKSFQPRRLI